MSKVTGYTVFEGKSPINGNDIVAIVTLNSKNIKTGNMASMWILDANTPPHKAVKNGEDESVCGNCKHRQFLGGACYVTTHQAPLAVYTAYTNGRYPKITDMSIFKGMSVRFGAYGDPKVIPMDILKSIETYAKNHTSYTHQWKDNDSTLKKLSMASVDNKSEAIEAQKLGWRTFRVTNDINDIESNEIVCPNTTKGITCLDCGLCKGNMIKAKNIVIEVHGSKKKKFKEKTLDIA